MFLSLETITPATGEPLSLAQAKSHLRVAFADDDAYITGLISVAREAAENHLGRPIRSAQYRANFDVWSTPFVIDGLGPVLVTQVDYLDGALARQTVPAASYQSGHGHQGQVICPLEAWPTDGAAEPLPRISFTAGFASVPVSIVHALLLHVQFFYDNRGSQVLTGQRFEDSRAWQALLSPYRIFGI